MPTTDLQPGTITTLGVLRPGDVFEFIYRATWKERLLCVVTRSGPTSSSTRYQDIRRPNEEDCIQNDTRVIFHGPGRIEPARIVMEGDVDPTIEGIVRRVLAVAVADGIATCAREPMTMTTGELVGPANVLSSAMREQQRRIAELEEQVRKFINWKSEQLAVENEWDEQEVAQLLGVPLGKSIRAAIQPGIEKLQQRVAELEGHVRTLRDGCEQIAKHIADGDEDIAQYLAYDLIAATTTKEKEK